jgi:hypothetical protein
VIVVARCRGYWNILGLKWGITTHEGFARYANDHIIRSLLLIVPIWTLK